MQNNVWKKELSFIVIGLFIVMSFNIPISGYMDDKYNKNTNEFIDNHPPETPYFSYYWIGGYEWEPLNFNFTTTDPDGDDVYYLIDWGDETNSGWLGPYKSGVDGVTTHVWDRSGWFYYRVKAVDIYGAESNWSLLGIYEISITPHVEIRIHRGFGFGVTVTVRNLGIKNYENIPWSFYFYNETWGEICPEKYGILKGLKVGEKKILEVDLFLDLN